MVTGNTLYAQPLIEAALHIIISAKFLRNICDENTARIIFEFLYISEYYGKMLEGKKEQYPSWPTILTQKITTARRICHRLKKEAINPHTGLPERVVKLGAVGEN